MEVLCAELGIPLDLVLNTYVNHTSRNFICMSLPCSPPSSPSLSKRLAKTSRKSVEFIRKTVLNRSFHAVSSNLSRGASSGLNEVWKVWISWDQDPGNVFP